MQLRQKLKALYDSAASLNGLLAARGLDPVILTGLRPEDIPDAEGAASPAAPAAEAPTRTRQRHDIDDDLTQRVLGVLPPFSAGAEGARTAAEVAAASGLDIAKVNAVLYRTDKAGTTTQHKVSRERVPGARGKSPSRGWTRAF
jgi:hypothetical protein